MKIVIACTNLIGHLNPMLSIGRLLIEEGHEVVVQTASVVRDRVESIGATFRAFPPEIDYDLRDLDARFPERKTMPPPERLTFDLKQVIDQIPAGHAGLQQVLQEFSADVVLADISFFGMYPMLLGPRSKRPAVIACGISFLMWHRDDGAPPILGLPPAQNAAEREQYAAIGKDFDANFEPIVRYLNDCLAGLGVGPIPAGFFDTMVVALGCLSGVERSGLRVSAQRLAPHGTIRRRFADRAEPGAASGLGRRPRRLTQGGAGHPGNGVQS